MSSRAVVRQRTNPDKPGDELARLRSYATELSPLPLVATAGRNHIVRYVNPAFCCLVGLAREELVGRPFADAVTQARSTGCLELLDSVYLTGITESLPEHESAQGPAPGAWWSYTAWAIRDEEERATGVMLQVEDATAAYRVRLLSRDMSQALLLSDLRQHEMAEEKDVLLSASQIVNSADSLERAMNTALELLPRLVTHFRSAAVFLADAPRRHMELYDVIGVDRRVLAFKRFAVNAHGFGWHPGELAPRYLPITSDPSMGRVARLDPGAGSCVCVGLRSLRGCRSADAMLYVASESANGFAPVQVELLQAFADRISLPLQRIRLQEGLEGLAFADGMTGLSNLRFFRSHLEDELKRAVRYRRPLSIILLDLDGFKRVNDTFGHPAGDKVIVDVADRIRTGVRETDVPARYGGEEFAIICPETAGPEAMAVAERVRAAVDSRPFVLDSSDLIAVRISVGVAAYPIDAQDEAGLVAEADAALYEAKRAGGNRVVAADAKARLKA